MKQSYNNYKPNQYITEGDIATIIITNRKGQEFHVTISREDFYRVAQYSWWMSTSRGRDVANAKIDGKNVKLHRFVTNVTNPEIKVDHINNNSLDNTQENLRLCVHKQNSYNTQKRKDNTSGFKGVVSRPSGKYQAKIKHNGKTIHIGTFSSPIDAHNAYCKKGIELFGEFFNPGY